MAARGLHLKKLGVLFAHFERGEAESVRYRVDFTNSEHILGDEQRELYAQSGWEYVCDQKNSRIFRSPEALNAPEINTDATGYARPLRSRRRELITGLIILALSLIFFFFMGREMAFIRFIEGGEERTLVIAALGIAYMIFALSELIFTRKFARGLREGREINHRAEWKRVFRFRRTLVVIFAVIYIGIHTAPLVLALLPVRDVVADIGTNPIHIRLADIETDSMFESRSSFFEGEIFRAGYIIYESSLYAPTIIDTLEYGVIPDKEWPADSGKSGEYTPNVSIKFYRLRFSWLADRVLEAFCWEWRAEAGAVLEASDRQGFDRLFTRSGKYSQEVFARRGNDVIYLQYCGDKDMETVIEVVRNWMGNL